MTTEEWHDTLLKVLAYRKLKAEVDTLRNQMDDIKAELLAAVEAHGKWTDEDGYARIVQRRPAVAFDTKALIALCKSMPEVEDILAPHRQVKAGYSYLQVK